MPAVTSRGRGRRNISEINMVPFIDVMLVLLIIFMVTAPLITPSMIAVPRVGKAALQPKNPVHILIGKDEAVQIKIKTDSMPSNVHNVAADIVKREPGVKAAGAEAVTSRHQRRQVHQVRNRGTGHGRPAKSWRFTRWPVGASGQVGRGLHSTMPSAADRLDFGPPHDAGSVRAFMLALLVHALLIAALTWGINWKSSTQEVSFEAELWSSVPQEAAPKLVEAPPPPPPPPPPPQPAEVKVTPPLPAVDIALEQEKKRKLLQQQKDAEALKAQKALKAEKAAEKLKAELQAKKEKQREEKAQEELTRRKAAEEAKKAQAKEQERQKLAAAAAEKLRQDALKRMMGLAGASGGANAKGSAPKSSGPSASYGGKVRAAVKPNVVFTDDVTDNPKAEIEVRTSLDGTIISQRLVKSSGNKAWDDAAIKAVIRTGTLPPDVDGRVPTPIILDMRPKD